MAPGGETFRFSARFGENVLRHGSHEWLPYSKDEVRLKSSNNNLSLECKNQARYSFGWKNAPGFLYSSCSPKPSNRTVELASPSSWPSIIRANCSPLMDSLASR